MYETPFVLELVIYDFIHIPPTLFRYGCTPEFSAEYDVYYYFNFTHCAYSIYKIAIATTQYRAGLRPARARHGSGCPMLKHGVSLSGVSPTRLPRIDAPCVVSSSILCNISPLHVRHFRPCVLFRRTARGLCRRNNSLRGSAERHGSGLRSGGAGRWTCRCFLRGL